MARPVSYYALFQGMAASKPTSWLFGPPHILSHLAYILGPLLAVWAVSLLTMKLIPHCLTPILHVMAFEVYLGLVPG